MDETHSIDAAHSSESHALSALARRSKSFWGYPEEWLDLWEDELRISERRIRDHRVEVIREAGKPIGVFVLVEGSPDAELDALWVDPGHMRRGFGGQLLRRAMECARAGGATRLFIDSDPNAVPFYESHGAVVIGTVPSEPAGRELPRMALELKRP